MFERSLLRDDRGRRRSLLEKDLPMDGICLLNCGLFSTEPILDTSEWETDFHTAVFGLDEDMSMLAKLLCEAVFGLLGGRSEYERLV